MRDRMVGPAHLQRVLSHHPYFQVAATGRVHRVRDVQRVSWPKKPSWLAIAFRCHGMSTDDKGQLLPSPPPDAALCDRCTRPRGPGRRARLGDLPGLVSFQLETDEW